MKGIEMKSERIFCEYILEIHTMPTHLNSVKGVSTMFQRSCVLQFCCCMDLIAATWAEGGLVTLLSLRKLMWGKWRDCETIGAVIMWHKLSALQSVAECVAWILNPPFSILLPQIFFIKSKFSIVNPFYSILTQNYMIVDSKCPQNSVISAKMSESAAFTICIFFQVGRERPKTPSAIFGPPGGHCGFCGVAGGEWMPLCL